MAGGMACRASTHAQVAQAHAVGQCEAPDDGHARFPPGFQQAWGRPLGHPGDAPLWRLPASTHSQSAPLGDICISSC